MWSELGQSLSFQPIRAFMLQWSCAFNLVYELALNAHEWGQCSGLAPMCIKCLYWVYKSRSTLWLKVKRLSISIHHIVRNQEFGFSTLHTRHQSPKVVALKMLTWYIFFYQGDGLYEGSMGRIPHNGWETINFIFQLKNKKMITSWPLD